MFYKNEANTVYLKVIDGQHVLQVVDSENNVQINWIKIEEFDSSSYVEIEQIEYAEKYTQVQSTLDAYL
jgi:hypothetical protein